MSLTSFKPEVIKYERRFSSKLEENLARIYERVFTKNKAGMVIIDGGIGEGKTTLGTECLDYFNSLHGLPPTDITSKQQIGLGGEDFSKKLVQCAELGIPAVMYDEAGDFNRRGALTQFNRLINRLFEMYRGLKVIVILCLPSFRVLDEDLFTKNIPRLLIHCYNRSQKQGNGKAFSLKRMMWIRFKMNNPKLVIKSQAYGQVQPNFYLHFRNLSEERSRELDKVSTKGKIKELKAAEIKYAGLLTFSDIARKVGRSEVWVKLTLKKLKLKPVKRFERRHYFGGEAVDVVLNWLDEGGTLKDTVKKKEAD